MPANPAQPASASRRRHLLAAALGGAGLLTLSRTAPAAAQVLPTATALPLTAQTTEGPFYFDPGKTRQDITEGQPGVALEVRFTVVDAHGQPLTGKRVDLWHCNAAGVYSGYAGQIDDYDQRVSTKGQTFLRGSQQVGADGVATFRTVYPGWYEGRATHLHMKVLDGNRALLTTQCFLPDALSEYLYTRLPAYKRQRVRETLNSNDGIALRAGDTVQGAVREAKGRYIATLMLVVDPAATSPREMFPPQGQHDDPAMSSPAGSHAGPPPGPPPGHGPHAALEGEPRVAAMVPGV
ncbi:intradiol ring-cleavage dioxygenase [Cupriavidus pauculus]|uniref:intradiol ring-cleavage dioxygenase n=1 Tax=Cupriavidus pauculus TaxID=82633 RepID=UPI001EE22C60|nr:intradiol ring-cleavage dioxygenase [Cupriavidus pauculus]GJG94175.1 intradiol ring-cleavage dioxygenase [Cupriavidus pauculus]